MRYLIIICCFFISFSTRAETGLSLEEKINLLFKVNPNDYFESQALNTIKDYCKSLKRYDHLNEKQRVKKVFIDIKKKHLYNYRLDTFFPDLFGRKTYNCVTGTALIALVFDELNIPYSIVKVPNHVYLLAYPKTHQIGVESTNKKYGIYQWNDYSKRLAINYLLTIKKITEKDIKENGIDLIIERYFYVQSDLSFENLIGIQFFNRSLYHSRNNSNEKALKFAALAYNYDNSEQSYFIYAGILSNLIGETESDDLKSIDYLTRYYDIETRKNRRSQITGHYEYAIYSAFHKRDDIDFIDESIRLINQNMSSEADKHLFLSYIELERTEWLIDQSLYHKGYKSAVKGYQMDSTNKRFEKMISFLIIQKLYDDEPELDELDSILVAKVEEFPFLAHSHRFKKFTFLSYIYITGEAFYDDDEVLGLKYIDKMSPYLEEKDLMEDDRIITSLSLAYGDIAAYYFRERNIEAAKTWIAKAIEINPDSASLKRKKEYIDDSTDYYKNNISLREHEAIIDEFERILSDEEGH